jgi:gliding motility-associated-like protein
VVELGADAFRCPGEEELLDANNGVAFYEWQNGSMAPDLLVTQSGTYAVTVTNGCGTVSDAVTYTYVPPLDLGLAAEYGLCAGDTLTIDVERPYATYRWADGSNAARRIFTENGSHALTVTTLCETYEAAFEAFFLEDPKLELGRDTLLCPGDSLVLDAGIPGSTYRWQDGSTSRTYTVRQPGTYELLVTTACNELRDSISVEYVLPVTTELGRDTFLCSEEPFLLDATTAVPADYRWEDGSSKPERLIFGPGVYVVTVTSQCEQVADTLTISECEKCPVYLPNAFSPNRDGVNDVFGPQGSCPLEEYELVIYDRWGNQVFVSRDPARGWDGRYGQKSASQGAYLYFLRYTVVENGLSRRAQTSGEVVLLR